MKILLVTGHFKPEIHPRSFRSTEIAIELARCGHTVKVITLRKIKDHNYASTEKLLGIEIENLGIYRSTSDLGEVSSTVGIMSLFYAYFRHLTGGRLFLNAWRICKSISRENQYDLVISFSNPFDCHLGVGLAKRLGKFSSETRIIADYGDPFSGSSQESKATYFQTLERWVLRSFSFIAVPFDGAKAAYKSVVNKEKIRIIPQGFNFGDLNKRSSELQFENPRFVYAGLFYKDIRNPRIFFRYLNTLDEPFKFHIYLRYSQEWVVHILRSEFPNLYEKVVIKVNVEREDLLKDMMDFEFAVNIGNTTTDQLPSKLIDYAICDLAICNIESEADLVKLREFIRGDFKSKLLIDKEKYNIRRVVSQFLEL